MIRAAVKMRNLSAYRLFCVYGYRSGPSLSARHLRSRQKSSIQDNPFSIGEVLLLRARSERFGRGAVDLPEGLLDEALSGR